MVNRMTNQRTRVQLDREMIIDAVLELATENRKEVTYKQLGLRLGVDATAMYRHFRNKEELLRASLDRLHGLAVEDAQAVDSSWRERLKALGEAMLRLYSTHPAVGVHGIMLDPQGQGENAWIEFVLQCLLEGGADEDRLVEIYGAISGLMLSYGAVAAHWNLEKDGSNPPTAAWISTLGPVDPRVHPHVHQYRNELLTVQFGTIFETAFDAILDSINPNSD